MDLSFNILELGYRLGCFVFLGVALAVISMLVKHIAPRIYHWSEFWVTLLAVALVPLIPISLSINDTTSAALYIPASTPIDGLASVTPSAIERYNNHWQTLLAWLLLGLAVTSFGNLIQFSFRCFSINRLIGTATPYYSLTGFTNTQIDYVNSKRIDVLVCNRSISPFVFGFWKARLLLSEQALKLPSSQLQLLIDHELTHIRRYDHKKIILFRLCATLFWFNPLLHYIEKQFLQAMELNCDKAVIDRHPGCQLDYARALIASLRISSRQHQELLGAHFSNKNSSKGELERRIREAMSSDTSQPNKLAAQFLLANLLFLSTCFSLWVNADILPSDSPLDLHSGISPVANARISSGYQSINKIRNDRPHKGVDLVAPRGSQVVASLTGNVVVADATTLHKNYGLVVVIDHGANTQTVYAHLDSVAVNVGDKVQKGKTIGTLGATGKVTGPHLHFELLEKNQDTNPTLLLK